MERIKKISFQTSESCDDVLQDKWHSFKFKINNEPKKSNNFRNTVLYLVQSNLRNFVGKPFWHKKQLWPSGYGVWLEIRFPLGAQVRILPTANEPFWGDILRRSKQRSWFTLLLPTELKTYSIQIRRIFRWFRNSW